MPVNGYQQYQRVQTETASPGDLVVMLYRGALRFGAKAELALEQHDFEASHTALVRAQEIVLELMFSLDLNAGQIAQNLRDLYDYMYQRLIDANCKKDVTGVKEVNGMLRELLPAWESAVAELTSRGTARIGAAV